ncbi:MAG TPA: hypothetical protein VET66_09900, partial [Steroidobacteraceae bacterium]|nr:hypothetical protein [Steroidobacteraceae bacterium]
MRLSLRFIVPLLLALAAFAYALVPLVDRLMFQWFVRDLDARSAFVANTVQEPLGDLLATGTPARVTQYFTRLTQDERLYALGFCASGEARAVATGTWPAGLRCDDLGRLADPAQRRLSSPRGALYVTAVPMPVDGDPDGMLVVVHDMSFIERRGAETRRYLFYLFIGLGVVVSLITVAVAQLSWRGWMQGLHALMRGEWLLRPAENPASAELRPVAKDLRALIRDIEAAHRPRDASDGAWTPDALRAVLHD